MPKKLPEEMYQDEYEEFVMLVDWRALYGYNDTYEDFMLTKCFADGGRVISKKEEFEPVTTRGNKYVVSRKDGKPIKQEHDDVTKFNTLKKGNGQPRVKPDRPN